MVQDFSEALKICDDKYRKAPRYVSAWTFPGWKSLIEHGIFWDFLAFI